MSIQARTTPGSHFRRGWIYALMLALVTINYMDRSALGVVAQAVRGEFSLSPVQTRLVMGAGEATSIPSCWNCSNRPRNGVR